MNWFEVIERILPFLAMQLYLCCFLYLTVSRKRYVGTFPFLILFLGAIIVFLASYLLDIIESDIGSLGLIQLRMVILFSIGFPSLTVANFKLCQTEFTKKKIYLLYGVGIVCAIMHSSILGLGWNWHFFKIDGSILGVSASSLDSFFWSKMIAGMAAILIVLIPVSSCVSSIRRQDFKSKVFVISTLLFTVFFLIGILTRQWWVYYLGSIMSALLCIAAVYIDLHHLNQTAAFIKEELRYQVSLGNSGSNERLSELVESLEASSKGNLKIYKMRIRQVFSMMTDEAIESGGDAEKLLKRNNESIHRIEEENDVKSLSKVAKNEAKEVSEIIINIPMQRKIEVITEVKEYVLQHIDQPLKINDVADKFCVSKSYLTNSFKEVEGQTFNQFVTHSRIKKSKELLRSKPVTEVAFEVGFNSSNYFATVFKKVTGKTPREFQEGLSSDQLGSEK